MKQFYLSFGLTLLLCVVTLPSFSQVSNDNEDEVYKVDQRYAKDFVPGQVLVKMKDGNPANVRRVKGKYQSAGISKLDEVLTRYGAEEMEQLLPKAKVGKTPRRAKAYNGQTIVERDLTQLYKVTLPVEKADQTLQLVEELKALDEVEYAEPNYKMYIMDAEIASSFLGNPFVTQQWYLDAYGVKQLWNKPIINPKRPVIAIIDTGVDMTHPDLAPNLWTNTAEAEGEAGYDNDGNGFASDIHGWDFINNTPNVRDFNMHGTHVAGIAAAANNGIGIIGANPRALIMPISVMQSDGTGDVATIVKGIDYAVANGATVLNLSLGTYTDSRVLCQALERAYQTAVIVAAAGNNSIDIETIPMFPAAYSFVLGVQALNQSGSIADFSNIDVNPFYSQKCSPQHPDGFNYELSAPGTNILSTIPGGKYKVLQGTSMASPLVAGAISALTMVKDYTKDEGLIHQEILWGDLLHTSNIAQAYAVTNRPAELDLQNIQMRSRKELVDETDEDYSGDREIDAGETVDLYPVIRTTFGSASNIKMHLEMGDEFEDPSVVEIINDKNNKVDFGMHLDAYGKGVSLNPVKVKVAENVADNRHIKLKIVATCDESSRIIECPFTIVVTNMVKINGLISEDMTLTANHVYLVNDNIAIMKGSTLTIEPGTRIEFMEGKELTSFGKLIAKGTPERPIVFTGHIGAIWGGIKSHESDGVLEQGNYLYMNADSTLFTLKQTDQTPIGVGGLFISLSDGASVEKRFQLLDYLDSDQNYVDYVDILGGYDSENLRLTVRENNLTDPNFLSPIIHRMISEAKDYCSATPSEYGLIDLGFEWRVCSNPRDTISYCRIEGAKNSRGTSNYFPYMKDCVIMPASGFDAFGNLYGVRNTITGMDGMGSFKNISRLWYSNIINNHYSWPTNTIMSSWSGEEELPRYSQLRFNNYFNNTARSYANTRYRDYYSLSFITNYAEKDKSKTPSYLGTSREDIIRPYIYEMGNASNTYGKIDLSNMRTTPVSEAHGIVWKVVVNGKDAQDEYEDLAPLGVGKHKFEVYFNRPMNKAVAPQISFGVRDPWTQNPVNEDGSWNEEGTIYTAYKTITGKTKSDGVNRIYVWGAEDNEFFEIPYEKDRFNINIQATGSLATGFAAEAKMGRVNLTWNNENNDFADAMGFNIYRYNYIEKDSLDRYGRTTGVKVIVPDTVCLNREIVDIETTEFTDYDVVPGTTYYYMYKVLSTDLQEYDVSNVVAATPLTSTPGDANGSGDVDVADVITTVNYATGMEPKPFIFEAADMNTDLSIDILDVIGIIQKILNPSSAREMSIESTAIYTIENGTLYVESPVTLAGVQVQLALSEECRVKSVEFATAADLDGFEHVSTWLSENDYLFMAYSMSGKTLTPGKHALLHIGEGRVASMRLSDAYGQNVTAIGGETTGIDRMGSDVMNVEGVYDLQGRKISNLKSPLGRRTLATEGTQETSNLKKGVYIINGQKVVK